MTLSSIGWSPVGRLIAIIGFGPVITNVSIADVGMTVAFLIALSIMAVVTHHNQPRLKGPLFGLMAVTVVGATLVISAMTVVLNFNSPLGGPVRWASDFQIWACGNQLVLPSSQNPLSNRVGSATLYAQGEQIRYTGVPLNLPDDASLGTFMQVAGGALTNRTLVVPLDSNGGFAGLPQLPGEVQPFIHTNANGSYASFTSGQKCGDAPAQVQAFVYHFDPISNTYSQSKLADPASYELSHTSSAPPGDCVIMEFAPLEDQTNHLCASYGVLDRDRCTSYGVPEDQVSRCDIQEVDP